MSKRATDHLEPSAKKRTQDRQGRKGDEDEEDSEEEQPGEFAKASEEVLKTRRIFKARRTGGGLASTQPSATAANGAVSDAAAPTAAKSSNPFAGVSLLGGSKPQEAPAAPAPAAAPAKAELGSTDAVVGDGDNANDEAATSPLGTSAAATAAGAGQPASVSTGAAKPSEAGDSAEVELAAKAQERAAPADAPESAPSAEGSTGLPPPASTAANAGGGGGFQGGFSFGSGLAKSVGGTGFGALAGAASSSGGFGAFASRGEAPAAGASGGGLFGDKPAFSFGASAEADASSPAQSVFGSAAAGDGRDQPPAAKAAVLAEGEKVETGEEDERTVFSGDGTLFSFDEGGWRERGRGELRVKVGQSGQARLVMRQRGNLRLLLNANLWADMAVNVMDGGVGVTFAVQNAAAVATADGKDGGAKEGAAAAGKPAADDDKAGAKLELTTFAFRVKSKQTLDDFGTAVEHYKKADAAAANV